jgi:hypothetical protein
MGAEDMTVSLSPSLSPTHNTHSRQYGGPTQAIISHVGPAHDGLLIQILNKWGTEKFERDGIRGLIEEEEDEDDDDDDDDDDGGGTHGLQSTRGHVRHDDVAQ